MSEKLQSQLYLENCLKAAGFGLIIGALFGEVFNRTRQSTSFPHMGKVIAVGCTGAAAASIYLMKTSNITGIISNTTEVKHMQANIFRSFSVGCCSGILLSYFGR